MVVVNSFNQHSDQTPELSGIDLLCNGIHIHTVYTAFRKASVFYAPSTSLLFAPTMAPKISQAEARAAIDLWSKKENISKITWQGMGHSHTQSVSHVLPRSIMQQDYLQ